MNKLIDAQGFVNGYIQAMKEAGQEVNKKHLKQYVLSYLDDTDDNEYLLSEIDGMIDGVQNSEE